MGKDKGRNAGRDQTLGTHVENAQTEREIPHVAILPPRALRSV